jgi:hypothetical protein
LLAFYTTSHQNSGIQLIHILLFYCRNEDFKRFKMLWLLANASEYNLPNALITSVDEILHQERLTEKGEKRRYEATLKDLPEGVIVTISDNKEQCYLYFRQKLWLWTEEGYKEGCTLNLEHKVNVLTPKSIVNVFRAGYIPAIHFSVKEI